jgi:hypothetical protein
VLGCYSALTGQVDPKKTTLTKIDREAWRSILKIPDDCEKSFQFTYRSDATNFGGLEFNHLRGNKYLVNITCYSGAYQPGFIYALYDESKPSATRLLTLKGFDTKRHGKALRYSLIDGFDSFN